MAVWADFETNDGADGAEVRFSGRLTLARMGDPVSYTHLDEKGGKVALVYLESPANPTNALVDVEAVRGARDAAFPGDHKPAIAIDNTFLGPLLSLIHI